MGAPGGAGGGSPDPRAPGSRMIVFRTGGERFALPLEAVREVVVPQPPFARVPRSSAAVRGAMNLRGRVVAVVEVAPLVGLARDLLAQAHGHVLVLDRARRGLGLLVAGVLGVETIAPASAAPAGALARCVVDVRGTPVTLLDPDALEEAAASQFGGSAS